MSINREALQDDARLGLDKVFWFGKYKGETIESVIDSNPKYVGWCVDNIKDFVLSNKAFKYLQECLDDEYLNNRSVPYYGDAGDPFDFGCN